MSFPAASITSALGCLRSFPMREIFSPSTKMSASNVSDAVMSVPFLIKVAVMLLLRLVCPFQFLDAKQGHQHIWWNIFFGQICLVELLILRTLAQGAP